MTLLDPTTNNDAANKAFVETVPIYKASPLLISQQIAQYKAWGPDQIDNRQSKLADEALKIWTM